MSVVLPQLQIVATDPLASTVAADAGFDGRWAAWIARGRAHEQRVRQKVVFCLAAVAIGAATVYALFRL
jgi:hypothetical protein